SVNFEEDFNRLVQLPIDYILTSCGNSKVTMDVDKFIACNKLALDNGVNLIAGSGLDVDNVKDFLDRSLACEIHWGSGVHIDKKYLNDMNEEVFERLRDICGL
ncbi:MAG: copper homeostasis protein CutC, partial [Erysipelotrichaceae bacterium]